MYLLYQYNSVHIVIIIIVNKKLLHHGRCSFISVKIIILQTFKNILEQLCINNVLGAYYNIMLVMVIILFLVHRVLTFYVNVYYYYRKYQ